MSRRFNRLSSLLILLLSSEVLAIGLGDIHLNSALNEPLRAEIVLLSATPEELMDLEVTLASAETFARYGIDRPFYLQDVEFKVVLGGVAGSVVQIRSRSPITEPFLTFLVEASWPSGRLLREYTVLLDPPTYTPPTVRQTPVITAPRRSTQSDSGRIERQPTPVEPAPQPVRPAPQPLQMPEPVLESVAPTPEPQTEPETATEVEPQTEPETATEVEPQTEPEAATEVEPEVEPVADDVSYGTDSSGDYLVVRHDTLWSIASRLRPDSRLTINQTMLSIFEANPEAFGGNINILRAGASLRIPDADDIFQISRSSALDEVQLQHAAWRGSVPDTTPETTTQPSLTLVPPDEDPVGSDYDYESTYEPLSEEDRISDRIDELEAADVPDQQSLIEIRDNELATLRQQLADIRGEIVEPPVEDRMDEVVDDAIVDESGVDDIMVDDVDQIVVDDEVIGAVDDTATAETIEVPTNIISTSSTGDDSIVDQIIEFVTGFWGMVIGALVLIAGALLWFMNRDDDSDDESRPWEALDSDAADVDPLSETKSMQAPMHDDAIIVVEEDSGAHPVMDETVEAPAEAFSTAVLEPHVEMPGETIVEEIGEASSPGVSLEDTFSSETAVNLDQTDPIAEADFHMAYGLYDQAADLISGALETDPTDKTLMSKLCEVYFVWGNRDAFVDAATKLNIAVGEGGSSDWDKIIIMGQQIAADHDLFAGAKIAVATQEVDLSFDDSDEGAVVLDMDFGDDSAQSEILDLSFGETDENQTIDSPPIEKTVEMPAREASDPFAELDVATSELPSLDSTLGQAISDSGNDADATAEIDIDELGLGVDSMAETEVTSMDDLEATGANEALIDQIEATGKNPAIDPDATGVRQGLDIQATGIGEGLDLEDLEATGMRLAVDETGQNPMLDAETEHDPAAAEIDLDLLKATGQTQVLSEDMAVNTATGLPDSDATMLAPKGDDNDDDEFDFAKTEALPADVFTDLTNLDETVETHAIAETDVDLDLDDLTAALKVSELDDTVEQSRDDATVEHPRPEIPEPEAATLSLAPEDMSDDLHEARTMTEVGTKLDLARAYVDMGDPAGARGILEEVLDEGDEGQKQQAQKLLDSLP